MIIKSALLPLKIIGDSFKNFYNDDCFTLSSSISFVFLLSIIPFATLNIFIFNLIQRIVFPDSVVAGSIQNFLAQEMGLLFPFVSEEWIKTYIVHSNNAYASFKIINFLLLPIVSSLVFKTLETSYRKIFRLPKRHLIFSRALYAILAIFIALFLFITSFTWNIISTPLMRVISLLNETSHFSGIDSFLNNNLLILPKINFLSIFLIIVFYLATIKIFLNVKIKFRHKIYSGLVFFTLWIVARELFQMYIEHISKVNLLYGSLSSIVIILMWVFYSSITLLYSIELLHVLHIRRKFAYLPYGT